MLTSMFIRSNITALFIFVWSLVVSIGLTHVVYATSKEDIKTLQQIKYELQQNVNKEYAKALREAHDIYLVEIRNTKKKYEKAKQTAQGIFQQALKDAKNPSAPNAQSRDAFRISAITQLKTALELYYAVNDQYPHQYQLVLGQKAAQCLPGNSAGFIAAKDKQCVDPIMSLVPRDPDAPNREFRYSGFTAAKTPCRAIGQVCTAYLFTFQLEKDSGPFKNGWNCSSSVNFKGMSTGVKEAKNLDDCGHEKFEIVPLLK